MLVLKTSNVAVYQPYFSLKKL